jgi:chondroitin AC lyase
MEGLMNHHYADGSNFISRTGEEYFNIFPVYDWQKIPGTTVVQKPSLPPETEIQKRGLTEFVGAVTNGKMGAAVFDFKCLIDPLSAKKSWFFFEKEYVCLGTGIDYYGDLPVVTTLNQCLLKGDVVVMQGNNRSIVSRGDHDLQNVKWIIHDNVAYVFPENTSLVLSNQSAKGSWYRINQQSDSPREEISMDVFKLWMDHGKRPSNAGYSYIVVPSVTESDLTGTNAGRSIEVLANNSDIQAVKHNGLNVCQMVFYKAGKISVAPDITIGMDSPGLIMVRTEGKVIKEISVSDPSRRLGKIHFSVSVRIDKKGGDFKATWDEAEGLTEISVDLPQGVYAGSSVTVIL